MEWLWKLIYKLFPINHLRLNYENENNNNEDNYDLESSTYENNNNSYQYNNYNNNNVQFMQNFSPPNNPPSNYYYNQSNQQYIHDQYPPTQTSYHQTGYSSDSNINYNHIQQPNVHHHYQLQHPPLPLPSLHQPQQIIHQVYAPSPPAAIPHIASPPPDPLQLNPHKQKNRKPSIVSTPQTLNRNNNYGGNTAFQAQETIYQGNLNNNYYNNNENYDNYHPYFGINLNNNNNNYNNNNSVKQFQVNPPAPPPHPPPPQEVYNLWNNNNYDNKYVNDASEYNQLEENEVESNYNEPSSFESISLGNNRNQEEKQEIFSEISETTGGTVSSKEDTTKKISNSNTNISNKSSSLPLISFDELQLSEMIGGGGFGQVWKGTWNATPVAVKVLFSPAACGLQQQQEYEEALQSSFEEEISILSRLRHPSICLLLGICMDGSRRAIVTELVSRGSLWDALRTPLPFVYHENNDQINKFFWPSWLIIKVIEGVGRGLAYLHHHKPLIVHRDLKSANILLDESFNVKICDFGLAKLRDASVASVMTANVGTVQWMAPEVFIANYSIDGTDNSIFKIKNDCKFHLPLINSNNYDEKVDIYSVGIVLWEMLTGECPYQNMKPLEIAVKVLNQQARPPFPTSCSNYQIKYIEKLWAQCPKCRPNAEEIVCSISDFFNN